jgi:hypothetical protein
MRRSVSSGPVRQNFGTNSPDLFASRSRVPWVPIPVLGIVDRQRFWTKVDRSGGPEACWPWKGGTNSNGQHGRFKIKGRLYSPHRIAYSLEKGPIPNEPDRYVLHSCDNGGCCNPKHIRIGSAHENAMDMVHRGRRRGPSGPNHPGMKNLRQFRGRTPSPEITHE